MLVTTPDGHLLMGVSATCDHCAPRSKWDGAIVSFEPDGSDLRLYASHIRAPVGLAYYPGTEDLLVSMNQRDDLGPATPGDWLSAVREGQSWGFPDCYGQSSASCSDAPRPLAVLDPHAAAGGVAVITDRLAPGSATSALVAEWNVAKVQRVAFANGPHGPSATAVTPFLRGLRNPLALTLAPNRSLLVADWATGLIYRLSRQSG